MQLPPMLKMRWDYNGIMVSYSDSSERSVGCIVISVKAKIIITIMAVVVFVWAQFAILIVQIVGMPPEQL